MTFPELTSVYSVYYASYSGTPTWRAVTGYVGTINGVPVMLYKECDTDCVYRERPFDPADWHATPEAAKIAAAANWQARCADEMKALLATA